MVVGVVVVVVVVVGVVVVVVVGFVVVVVVVLQGWNSLARVASKADGRVCIWL